MGLVKSCIPLLMGILEFYETAAVDQGVEHTDLSLPIGVFVNIITD
jgi:hypothetical protein